MQAHVLALVVVTVMALLGPLSQAGLAQPVVPKGIWMDRAELTALPASGSAWKNLVDKAQESCPTPNLSFQDDPTNVCVMAKALVFARKGDSAYRLEVVSALRAIVNSGVYTGTALALGRELVAYVIAADLIDLKTFDPDLNSDFRETIKIFLTTPTLGGPASLIECHEKRPNNWGTHCGASRVAVAAYLGDKTQLARVAKVFKGWLGDRASYKSFSYGDLSWQCDPTKPVGVNPAGCTRDGHSIDGVLPEEQRRSLINLGAFIWPPPQENYVYEALQGALVQAVILKRAGYPVFDWENRALLRAFKWLHTQAQYPASGDDTWQPHLVNYFYYNVSAKFPAPIPSSPGKNVGWTDWTHAGKPRSTSSGSLEQSYTAVADSSVRGGTDASKNFGSSRDLYVRDASAEQYDRRIFLRFDLAGFASEASNAVVRIRVSGLPDGGPVPVCVVGVNSNTWSESKLTWQNQPPIDGTLSCQTVNATGWISFDVTSFVNQALMSGKLVSVGLVDTTITNRTAQFESRETSNEPVLTVK